jgi:hypothetical protein
MSEIKSLVALRSELADLKAENDRWEKAYAEAERVMTESLAPYRSHHSRIAVLERAIRILETG